MISYKNLVMKKIRGMFLGIVLGNLGRLFESKIPIFPFRKIEKFSDVIR